MIMKTKRLTLFAGHYGSGKTNIAGNYAIKLAREGKTVEREAREITIHSIAPSHVGDNEYEIEVECSSGTYIRSLISDIGEALGCGAVMTSLRRTKANGIDENKCYTLSQLEKLKEEGRLEEAVKRVDELLSYGKIRVSEAQTKRFSNGGSLDCNRFGGDKSAGLHCVYSPDGDFLGIGEIDEDGQVMSARKVYVEL